MFLIYFDKKIDVKLTQFWLKRNLAKYIRYRQDLVLRDDEVCLFCCCLFVLFIVVCVCVLGV